MPVGCCKNKVVIVKLKDNYTPSTTFHFPPVKHSFVALFYSAIDNTLFAAQKFSPSFVAQHSPPDIVGVSINILYRSILI